MPCSRACSVDVATSRVAGDPPRDPRRRPTTWAQTSRRPVPSTRETSRDRQRVCLMAAPLTAVRTRTALDGSGPEPAHVHAVARRLRVSERYLRQLFAITSGSRRSATRGSRESVAWSRARDAATGRGSPATMASTIKRISAASSMRCSASRRGRFSPASYRRRHRRAAVRITRLTLEATRASSRDVQTTSRLVHDRLRRFARVTVAGLPREVARCCAGASSMRLSRSRVSATRSSSLRSSLSSLPSTRLRSP